MGPHDDEMYDDAPRSRWRGGALTAVTLIVCATLGSAGAYGYRSYSTRAPSMPAPPVITAEQTPTKVVPADDPQSSKAIQDRIRDQGPNERVVSREEQPVEPRNLTAVAPSRPGLPAPVAPSQAQASAPALPPASLRWASRSGCAPSPYRPDGTEISGRPVGSLGPSTAPGGCAATWAAPAAAARNGGPISLDPQAPASAPPPAARERPATAVPPPTRPACQRHCGRRLCGADFVAEERRGSPGLDSLAAGEIPASAQRPTADRSARRSRRQGRLLPRRGRAVRIAGEANSLCSGLKAAGGQCIVQKNWSRGKARASICGLGDSHSISTAALDKDSRRLTLCGGAG